MSSGTPRSAYIHIPFCRHRCGYCNFTVIAGRDDLAWPLLQALAIELDWSGGPHEVETLYVGGGTPTQLGSAGLASLCRMLDRDRPLVAGGEWTVEANPEDVNSELVAALVGFGVTRVSLGVQSFDDAKLRALDRRHTSLDARRAVELIQQAGLRTAVDLIFAAPGESLSTWQRDVDEVVSLRPDHVSTYGLTIERGTAFGSRVQRGDLSEVDEQIQCDMYLFGIDRLQAAGYEHYEVSNFALPGGRSRHNEVYWAGAEYFAEGPGAARYVDRVRETNHRSVTTYLKRVLAGESPVAERERLARHRRAREMLVLGLRRMDGVQRSSFASRCGFDLDALAGAEIARFVEAGWLEDDGRRVRLTRNGLVISDSLWPDLL